MLPRRALTDDSAKLVFFSKIQNLFFELPDTARVPLFYFDFWLSPTACFFLRCSKIREFDPIEYHSEFRKPLGVQVVFAGFDV